MCSCSTSSCRCSCFHSLPCHSRFVDSFNYASSGNQSGGYPPSATLPNTPPCPLSFSNLPPSAEKGKFDELIEDKGVKILIDPKALMHVIGTKMDFVDDKLRSEFIFINPNSKGQCGCGESFMTTRTAEAAKPGGEAGS
ncbi:uncharacterized protein LOC130753816 [Actinidia eriantha]|uniref:uncharacterized protein LOC130753816 n=1 Tax=Actinidia eriantha TaxID=165200 RepID=UPI002589F08C|nr:uncharacterized protein LOC130753816 [Actinidia eriantha]